MKPEEQSGEKPTLDDLLDEVQEIAFQVFSDRICSGQDGDDMADWIKAEELVSRKHNL